MAQRPRRSRRRRGQQPNIARIGFKGAGWRDSYHVLMTIPVPALLGLLAAGYMAANVIFAVGYLAIGGIVNARPGSFDDAFFFSIQTMATIGYGNMYPQSLAANLVATAEAVFGLLSVALSTGVMFARVSRPTARVEFSRHAVISVYDGMPALMFRVANQRRNQIVEAQITVTVVRDELTREGQEMRRFHELKLLRTRNPIFSLTWTVIHLLDEESPLAHHDEAALRRQDALIVCSITGLDETFVQTVHARHTYVIDDLHWNKRLADILVQQPTGGLAIDYTRFHEVVE